MKNHRIFKILLILGIPVFLFLIGSRISAAPLPNSLDLETLEGQPLDQSSYEGKALVLVFWANWCIPCRKEVPQLNALQQEGLQQHVKILGINEDDEVDAGLAFVRRYGPQYPSVKDQNFQFATSMKVRSLPQVVVVSPEGEELYRAIAPPSPEKLLSLIEKKS